MASASLIVEGSRQRGGFGCIENLHAGSGERKDLHRDAGVVHVAQPPFAQILNSLGKGSGARGRPRIESPQTAKSGIVVAVFKQLAISRDQFRRREGFFSGNAAII